MISPNTAPLEKYFPQGHASLRAEPREHSGCFLLLAASSIKNGGGSYGFACNINLRKTACLLPRKHLFPGYPFFLRTQRFCFFFMIVSSGFFEDHHDMFCSA
jgi:hypothetical protein